MKKRIALLSCLLISTLPSVSFGKIYSYITKSTITNAGTTVTYDFVVDSWDKDDPTPSPCYKQKQCLVLISHRHKSDNTGGEYGNIIPTDGYRVGSDLHPAVLQQQTMGDLATFYQSIRSMPLTGQAMHSGAESVQECVGIFYSTTSGSTASLSNLHLMPGSVCGIAPPPAGVCGFSNSTSQINLNHGSLSSASVNGNYTAKPLTIECSSSMALSLVVKTDASGRIKLKNTTNGSDTSDVYSAIKVNGTNAYNGYTFNAGTNGTTLTISSTLSSSGAVGAGNYSGMAIAVLSIL